MVQTNAINYPLGAVVRMRLENRTGHVVHYNLCRSKLEAMDGDGGWYVVQETLAERCTAELRTLPPGAAAAYQFRLDPPAGRRGQYRVRVRLEDPVRRAPIEALSNQFTMRRD